MNKIAETFGKKVFNDIVMREKLQRMHMILSRDMWKQVQNWTAA